MNNQNEIKMVLDEYKIKFNITSDKLHICLDDFVQNIAECKSSYITKIKDKEKINGLWYKDFDTIVSELCPKLRSRKAKEFQEKLKKINDIKQKELIDSTDSDSNNETETLGFFDIRNNYFQYKGKKVITIVKDGVIWFKGVDLAKLLEYDIHNIERIYSKIPEVDKLTFDTLINEGNENQNSCRKAIFVTLGGMYIMVMQSIKPEARVFQSWVCREVLPSINRFGSYSIEKKYGCFYDDHDLFEFNECNVCYIAYIGIHDNMPLFKYGITFDYYRREYQEHRKTFDTFQLVYLRQTDNNHKIEDLFTNECKSKDVYIQKEFNGKNRRELFTINESHSFERMRMIMDKLIEQNPTKEYQKYKDEIIKLKDENEKQSNNDKHKIELLETIINEKNVQIQRIESYNYELQKEKNFLYQMFTDFKEMITNKRFL